MFPFNGHTSLREAALIYAREGFSVIPLNWLSNGKCSCGRGKCASPAKHPFKSLAPNGLKNATTDPATIETWWKKFPKCNIGVVTGDVSGGLIVVDVDLKNSGNVSVKILDIPTTLEVETGNGFHFWLKSQNPIKNSAGKLGQGIDVRGNGGYVVAPPSIHYSGRNYSFRNQDPIAEFPEELILKLAEEEKPEVLDPDGDLTVSYKSSEIATIVPEGSRNNELFKKGSGLRARGYAVEEIEALLIAYNRKRCSPPLDDSEVRQIARSVSRYAPAEDLDSQIEEEDLSFDMPEQEQEPDLDQEDSGEDQNPADAFPDPLGRDPLIGAMTADDYDQADFPEGEMILQGLRTGEWGLIVGIGNVGKTTLLLNVCVSLSAGRPFPPFVPLNSPARRILFVAFEDSDFKLQRHIRKIREALNEEENKLVGKNLHLVVEPEINGHPWKLTDAQSLKNLAAYIKKHKIDLVVIDTLSQAAHLKDENNNGEVQNKVVLPIRRLVKYCNVALLFVHHEGRGKPQQNIVESQYAGRGASALMDGARYQINLALADKNIRGVVKVSNPKEKGEGFDDAPVTLALDKVSRWFSPYAGTAFSGPSIEDSIIQTLEACPEPKGMETGEIGAMFPKVSRATIMRTLKKLVADGLIIKTGWGRYGLEEESDDTP